MTWLTVLKALIVAIATFCSTSLPVLIKFIGEKKKGNAATTEAEKATTEAAKEKAYNDMLATAQSFIAAAELAYKSFDAVMKQQGSSAGAMKKESVITKLQAYALANHYEFDAEFWSNKIDEIVKFTKTVNARK